MFKLCSVILVALLATGCFSDDDQDSEHTTAGAQSQSLSLMSIISPKEPDEDEDGDKSVATAPYTPPFGIQPLPKANLFGLQPSPEDQAYNQKTQEELAQQLRAMAQMEAVNRYNNAARDLQMDVQRLRSTDDANSVARVRRSFDATLNANRELGNFDSSSATRNQHELNQIERPLKELESVHSWVK